MKTIKILCIKNATDWLKDAKEIDLHKHPHAGVVTFLAHEIWSSGKYTSFSSTTAWGRNIINTVLTVNVISHD